MKIIRPATIDEATLSLTSSTVPDVPPSAWDSGTTYGDGDRAAVLQADSYTWKVYESIQAANTNNAVTDTAWWLYLSETYGEYDSGTTYGVDYIVISTTTNHQYQSLQASNLGHSLSDTSWWLDLGATNRYAMFDNSNSTQTVRGDSIEVVAAVTGRADSISLLNIVGSSVTIVITTVDDGEIYNETFNLVTSNNVSNWYEYFFEPVTRKGDFVLYDLPLNLNPTFDITLSESGGTAKIGACVFGQSRDLGNLLYGAQVGIQDFSRKETDDFGNFTIVERAFSKRGTFKALVPNNQIDFIVTVLAQFRATACVFVGVDTYTSTWIYGFYKDFEVEIAFMEQSYLTIILEGLT